MKTIATGLAALIALTTTAFAQSTVEDADGNGAFSYAELAVGYPSMTEETFMTLDTDESGDISPDELSAGLAAGLIEL